ncbi:MAG: tail fiber domain-containing protein, partial [Ferruginibacter sp.]
LFSAAGDIPLTPGNLPIQGSGRRMLWYPGKAAFRAGFVDGTQWDKSNIGDFSFAAGKSTVALGYASTALGIQSTASNTFSTAMGGGTTASGVSSTSMGNLTIASGDRSTAMGYGTTAIGNGSTSMGVGTNATGIVSIAMGQANVATGDYSIAMGFNTIASGGISTAMGSFSQAYGFNTTAIGQVSIAKGYSSTVVGAYNDTILLNNELDNFSPGTPLFMVGNGNSHSSRSNALTVFKNGKVGIGTNAPLARLHVADSSVLFSAPGNPANQLTHTNPPVSGEGRRMMWYPDKAALRAGYVDGPHWDKDSVGNFSTAMGFNTVAAGAASTALGFESTAPGDVSTAIGNAVVASGINSTAMGQRAIAAGALSVAIGLNVIANSYFSMALGVQNNPIVTSPTNNWVPTEPLLIVGNGLGASVQSNAFAIAKNGSIFIDPSNKSDGTLNGNSLLFGTYNGTGEGIVSKRTALGNQYGLDFLTGNLNRMSISNAGNVGIGTNAPGFPLSFQNTLGDKISLWGSSGVHYGIGVQSTLLQIHTDGVAADVAFGYGSSASFIETMRIKGNGKVGIGTNNPSQALHIIGNENVDGTIFARNTVTPTYYGSIRHSGLGGNFHLDTYGAGSMFLNYFSGSGVLIGNGASVVTATFATNGNLNITGTLSQGSDIRLKTNIEPLTSTLQNLQKIKGYTYNWIDKSKDNDLQYGVLAQEVQEIFPHLVKEDKEGMLSVNYMGLIPVMIESIKEQQKQIDELKKLVDQLIKK